MRHWSLVIAYLACAVPITAHAVVIPPSAEASRADSSKAKEAQIRDLESYSPIIKEARAPELSPELAKRRFHFKSLTLDGNTAFPAAELAGYYQDKLGQNITVAELFDILAHIQQRYLDTGYTLTRIFLPEQNLEQGNIHFTVVEGYVAAVDVDPSLKHTPLVDATREEILAMKPLNTLRLERLLLLLNDRPGLHIVSILSPPDSKNDPAGAIRLTLRRAKEDKVVSGSIGFDNEGSNYIGPYEFTGGIRLAGDVLPFNSDLYVYGTRTVPDAELGQLGMRYTVPVWGASGTTLNFAASMARTVPGESLKTLAVQSQSRDFSLGINYPLIRQRSEYLQLSGSFDLRNTDTNLSHSLLYDDRIRSITLGGDYSFADAWGGMTTSSLSYRQGLDILGARKTGESNLSRLDGHSDFHKIGLQVSRGQSITGPWSVWVSASGQYAFEPLLSSEEFGLGGSSVGRGYDPSEITGDDGVSASAELRYANLLPESLPGSDGFIFYDIGKVWNTDPTATNQASAASAGFGVHFQPVETVYLDTTLALPLTRKPENPPHYAGDYAPRLLISLKKQF